MPAPNDLNSRIALRKGWKLRPADYPYRPTLWQKPDGTVAVFVPDYVGTLKGMAGMMQELNEHAKAYGQYWWWGQNSYRLVDAPRDSFICVRHGLVAHTLFLVPWFWSDPKRPGDCVGDAYLSVKKAVDASTD